MRKLCRWLLYKRLGWHTNIRVDHPSKYIICLAPHTSNWDFIIGQLYMHAEGMHVGFLMKKEWFFWPLGILFRNLGGVPVYRDGRHSLTDQLSERAQKSDRFSLCVTPEGTRSLTTEWKKGFHFIATKAGIPVLLYGLDYKRKLIECTCSFVPTGDIEKEMQEIKKYFKDYKGLYPEKFSV